MNQRIVNRNVIINDENVKAFFENRYKRQLPHRYNYVIYQDKNPELALQRDMYEKSKFLPFLKVKKNSFILDIGCGVGRWGDELVQYLENGRYIGVDLSDNLLAMAKEELYDTGKCDFFCGDFRSIDKLLSDNGIDRLFDIILINGVLMYINDSDIASCLHSVTELLNGGGIVYIKESVGKTERLTLNDFYSDELKSFYSAIYRSIEEYKNLFNTYFDTDNYIVVAQGETWKSEQQNKEETASYYWIIEKIKNRKPNIKIEKYSDENEKIWDEFVMAQSCNGTFLQTRRFLNYHPKERFKDFSLMAYNEKGELIAVSPACIIEDGEEKIFFSHKGSTFGGIVFSLGNYKLEKVIETILSIEEYLKQNKFTKCYFKITPDIFSRRDSDLLRYVFYYLGYKENVEINLYVDLSPSEELLKKNMSHGKRENVRICEREKYEVRRIYKREEIESFHTILKETLNKYGLKPVHTVDELCDLQKRIGSESAFWGMYDGTKMIAGSMLFFFEQAKVAHTQYLCSKKEYNKQSAMTYLYYTMMLECKKMGYKKISWGIASEHGGKELNYGLAKNKESFGSQYLCQYTFYKEI